MAALIEWLVPSAQVGAGTGGRPIGFAVACAPAPCGGRNAKHEITNSHGHRESDARERSRLSRRSEGQHESVSQYMTMSGVSGSLAFGFLEVGEIFCWRIGDRGEANGEPDLNEKGEAGATT